MRIWHRFKLDNAVTLHRGDCLKLLTKIPDESVQIVVTSPPYNIGKEYEENLTVEQYLNIQRKVIGECVRVTRRGGSICWQVGHHMNGTRSDDSPGYHASSSVRGI